MCVENSFGEAMCVGESSVAMHALKERVDASWERRGTPKREAVQ